MSDLRHDLRHALRSFSKQPGFTATVLITLALGIGASTAMFSVLNAVLLKPLPQTNASRIVRLYQPNDNSATTGLSPLELVDFRSHAAHVLDDVVEYHSMPFTFIGEREAQRLQTGVVSASYFETMGIRPLVGRTFLAGEDQPGAEPVLVLSHEYWQREFGGDADVVGRTLRMNDRTHTVIGVLPPFPQYPDENDVYMPVSSCPFRSGPGWAENRAARSLAAFALLRSGTTRDAALSDLRTVSARLQDAYPESYQADVRYDVTAVPLAELIAQPARATLVILLVATILLLAIVCSNVGNLMIVRLLRRDSEMAVRLAFGATRGRLLRQLVTESGALAAVGGALGLLVAFGSTGMLATFLVRFTPRATEIAVDGNVLLFAFAATATTALASSLLPLAALRGGIAATLRQGSGRSSASSGHTRMRNVLIVLQVAVSMVLLVGAGLLMRTVVHLQSVDTGFDAAGVMTAQLSLNWTRYDEQDRINAFYRDLEAALRQVPGIQEVGIGSTFPLNGDQAFPVNFAVEVARATGGADGLAVAATTANAGYFAALGLPMLRGRTFNSTDEVEDAPVAAVVTRSLAAHYWPGADPIGRRISLDGGANWGTVVGVVGDVRLGLEGDYDNLVFVPHARFGGGGSRVLVRSILPPASVERALRTAVASIDAQQPITEILPLEAHRGERISPYRLTALLMGLFAIIALGVTAVGLAGVIAFSVAQRTREIGIRVAIGARPAMVLRMVLGQMVLLALVGTGIGVGAALYASQLLQQLVVGVALIDPLTYVGVALVLLVVTTAAGLVPARQAVRIDPLAALHQR